MDKYVFIGVKIMNHEEWQKILNEINSNGDLNGNNIIEKIKEKLQKTDSNRDTLLYHAAENGYTNIVIALIEGGADVNQKGGALLCCAIEDRHTETVTALIEKGADVNAVGVLGWTPLYCAVVTCNLDIAKLLIGEGADVNKQNEETFKNGDTPLHLAAEEGHLDMVKLLIEKEANVNVQNNDGDTPLHLAARKGNSGIMELLLKKADINIKNKNGNIPLSSGWEKEIIYIPADNLFWNVLLGKKEEAIKILEDPYHKSVFVQRFQNCWLFINESKAEELADKVAEKKYGEVINVIKKRQAVGLGIISGVVAMTGIALMILAVPTEVTGLVAMFSILMPTAMHAGISFAHGCRKLDTVLIVNKLFD